ncbi:nitrate reductase cytochrome c-type subunit [Arcobacter arenosus]|uniref:Periplasmic nitrate reductase, electron transfer subunit n=1 Tax=Arcobacter arenosus TaxID=2576037 RepID=A0A5R8XZM9_9BACT|nr:nitrate reductase cytochrome c-type subunit [Arcobacter arenosus]TLP37067.1 nitrate reductase [Arcobacter arenosus]
MRLITKIGLGIVSASVLFVAGCAAAQQTVSEESLGLRKVDLYSENTVTPEETKYSQAVAGTSTKIVRAFQDAPPMIPHSTEGMLPITVDNNQCVSCHTPGVAETLNALPYPKSHMTNFRPTHKFDGKKFEKSIDNMKNEIAISEMQTLAGARFNCSQCHAPQSEGQLVENTFQAEYTSKDGASKSSWEGTSLTEGLDTLMK